MKLKEPPFLFAISDHDVTVRNWHALIAHKLTNGGFDVGPMLWTASPQVYSTVEIKAFWSEALTRAGIGRMDMAHDPAKQRTWFKVWRKEAA